MLANVDFMKSTWVINYYRLYYLLGLEIQWCTWLLGYNREKLKHLAISCLVIKLKSKVVLVLILVLKLLSS